MHTINQSKLKNLQTKFVQYDQSDKVKSFNGSSVSYASAVVFDKWLKIQLFRIDNQIFYYLDF